MFCWYVNPDGDAWNLAHAEAIWLYGSDEIVVRYGAAPYSGSEGNVPTVYKAPNGTAARRELLKILKLVGAKS